MIRDNRFKARLLGPGATLSTTRFRTGSQQQEFSSVWRDDQKRRDEDAKGFWSRANFPVDLDASAST